MAIAIDKTSISVTESTGTAIGAASLPLETGNFNTLTGVALTNSDGTAKEATINGFKVYGAVFN